MSKRVLIILAVGVLIILAAFFLLKYELTKAQDLEQELEQDLGQQLEDIKQDLEKEPLKVVNDESQPETTS